MQTDRYASVDSIMLAVSVADRQSPHLVMAAGSNPDEKPLIMLWDFYSSLVMPQAISPCLLWTRLSLDFLLQEESVVASTVHVEFITQGRISHRQPCGLSNCKDTRTELLLTAF